MTRLLIFEDDADLRSSIVQLLEMEPDFQILDTAGDCREVLKMVQKHQPDFVLLDIDMPFVNGIDGLHLIKSYFPEVKTMMLTVFDDNKHVLDAICLGADGYILKHELLTRLASAIRELLAGGAPMTPSIARKVLELFPKRLPLKKNEYDLTDREREVLTELANGSTRKSIAQKLGVEVSTLGTHFKNIYSKLNVHSASEALRKAIDERLIQLS